VLDGFGDREGYQKFVQPRSYSSFQQSKQILETERTRNRCSQRQVNQLQLAVVPLLSAFLPAVPLLAPFKPAAVLLAPSALLREEITCGGRGEILP
jgi:hypothetical protein